MPHGQGPFDRGSNTAEYFGEGEFTDPPPPPPSSPLSLPSHPGLNAIEAEQRKAHLLWNNEFEHKGLPVEEGKGGGKRKGAL